MTPPADTWWRYHTGAGNIHRSTKPAVLYKYDRPIIIISTPCRTHIRGARVQKKMYEDRNLRYKFKFRAVSFSSAARLRIVIIILIKYYIYNYYCYVYPPAITLLYSNIIYVEFMVYRWSVDGDGGRRVLRSCAVIHDTSTYFGNY